MEFEWDSSKAASNYAKHRVMFEYATRVFLDPHHITAQDTRRDYGEPRYNAMGLIEQRLYIVSFTRRGTMHRLISARKGNSREQKKYRKLCP